MSSKFLIPAAVVVALTLPAFGQGAGGGGSGGSGGGSASTSATGGTSARTAVGTPSSATGGTQDNHNVQQSNTAKAVQQQRDAATTGSNTAPSQPGDGAVSAPNVGVGHAANGLPIGASGSGLGSPENSVGSTATGTGVPARR